jgi:ribosomal protein S18 acetylase RimI-like enzyme
LLHVEHDNLAAQSLYRDLGFVEHDSHCWWGRLESEPT